MNIRLPDPVCPFCARGKGEVHKVTVGDGNKTLTLTCSNCSRTWDTVESDHESQFLWGAGDRSRHSAKRA